MAIVSLALPDPDAFIALRATCGWGTLTRDQAKTALAASLISVVAHKGDTLIAMGRVIGDGAIYFYLQDVIVHPDHRGTGIGHSIVARLMSELKQTAPSGACVALLSAHRKEAFYGRFGFQTRPSDTTGAGMSLILP